MEDFTDGLLALIQKPSVRADVVPLYATAILLKNYARPAQGGADWRKVNTAIAERWSWAAVDWIKREAWKRADESAKALSPEPVN